MHVKWSRSLDGIVHNNQQHQHRAVSRSSSPDLPGPLVVLPDSADSCTAESDSNSGCSLSATAAAEQSDLQGRSKTLRRKTAKQVELMKAANATAANTIATANTSSASSASSAAYPPPLLNSGSNGVGSRSYKDSNNNNDHNHDDQEGALQAAEIEGFLAAGSRSRGGQNDDEADEEHLLALTGNGNNAEASTSQSHEMSHSRSTTKYLQQPMSPTSSRALLASRDSYASSPPSSSISSNRITSKGALSTLIGLFRFRPNDEYHHHSSPSSPSAHFHPSKLPPSKSAANHSHSHSHHHRSPATSASQFRRRMSLERLNSRERHDQSLSGGLVATVTSTTSSKNYHSSQMNTGGSLRAGRRASSLQSLTDVLNSFNRSELLSPPSGCTRPRPLVGPASSPSFVIADNKVTSSSTPDATSKRRVSSWENDPPKRHLVKFVNDEPQMLLCSALKNNGKGARSYHHYQPKGILRVRNPQHSSSSLDSAYTSNYSEIVSFRTASSASPSANSSSSSSSSSTAAAASSSNSSGHFHSSASLKKNVHFAQPLLTTYAICDGS